MGSYVHGFLAEYYSNSQTCVVFVLSITACALLKKIFNMI